MCNLCLILYVVNINQREFCVTVTLQYLPILTNYRQNARRGAKRDPDPLPEGLQALQESLQDHGELGRGALALQVQCRGAEGEVRGDQEHQGHEDPGQDAAGRRTVRGMLIIQFY